MLLFVSTQTATAQYLKTHCKSCHHLMKPTGKMTILPLVVVCVFLSSALCFTTTTLRSLPARNVTSAEYSCPAVSTLSCARLCKGYSHCISFAFDRSAGVCHLHPVLGAGLVATPLRIYQDTGKYF